MNILSLLRPKWVKVNSILYQKPCALLLRVEMDHPVFGNLEDIFVIDNRVLFQLSVLETSNFNVHLQAHTVNHTQDREILLHKNLPSPFPMHIHRVTVDDSSFSVIICKYHICNVLY